MSASSPRRTIVFREAPTSSAALLRMTVGAVILVTLGVLLGYAVNAMSPLPPEQQALAALAEDRSPATTTFFLVVTRLGDLWAVTLAAALVTPLLYRLTGGWQAPWLLWAALLGSLLVTTVIKVVVGRARPLDALTETASGAFPSGHTSRAAAVLGLCVWAVLVLSRHTGVRAAGAAVLGAGIILMGLSRLYLGVHWPSDVIFGVGLGLGWLTVVLNAVSPQIVPVTEVADRRPSGTGPRFRSPPAAQVQDEGRNRHARPYRP